MSTKRNDRLYQRATEHRISLSQFTSLDPCNFWYLVKEDPDPKFDWESERRRAYETTFKRALICIRNGWIWPNSSGKCQTLLYEGHCRVCEGAKDDTTAEWLVIASYGMKSHNNPISGMYYTWTEILLSPCDGLWAVSEEFLST